jgi:hypothetical protein
MVFQIVFEPSLAFALFLWRLGFISTLGILGSQLFCAEQYLLNYCYVMFLAVVCLLGFGVF